MGGGRCSHTFCNVSPKCHDVTVCWVMVSISGYGSGSTHLYQLMVTVIFQNTPGFLIKVLLPCQALDYCQHLPPVPRTAGEAGNGAQESPTWRAAGSAGSKDGLGGAVERPEVPVALPVAKRTVLAARSPENGAFLLLNAFSRVSEQGSHVEASGWAKAELEWKQQFFLLWVRLLPVRHCF